MYSFTKIKDLTSKQSGKYIAKQKKQIWNTPDLNDIQLLRESAAALAQLRSAKP